jgi:colanic acid biosynthesis glycosyl transferase WcaI
VPHVLLYYHFFHPDDVVGARQFTDLAVEQQRRGWDVTVLTSNRSYRGGGEEFPTYENWNGIHIHRVFRPNWDQSQWVPRLGNSTFLMAGSFLRALALRRAKLDVIVIGSDPAFSPMLALPLRLAYPSTAMVHWCFDLYPEAIAAEGGGPLVSALVPVARALMKRAYGKFDHLVDLGPKMRERLASYGVRAAQETLVPWALVEVAEPGVPDPEVRSQLFGDAKLALLYSGTMGRAHEYTAFLRLARACRARSGRAISFCFASRGSRQNDLRRAVTPEDVNVSFAPFAEERDLRSRLESADLHLLSLRPEWGGIVVPSKFFGSLAVGRPVIFAGPPDSEIGTWIAEHDVGLRVEEGSIDRVVDHLHRLIESGDDLHRWQRNTLRVYQREFSKRVINDRWDALLRSLVRSGATDSEKS